MTRARDAGVPPLNEVRRQIFAETNDGQLAPYTSWSDFGQHLKHPESLVNFVAAYGTHPTILGATTIKGKRAAARAIVDPRADATRIPGGRARDFMFSTGRAGRQPPAGVTTTGLDDVDLWVGGLAEVTNLFGGLLGSTFNYVFQTQMESLQDGDRFYYLNRTPGMNLRTQLEGNSFSEMIQRNTDGTNTLKADVFATADCKFQLSRITGPYDGSPTVLGARPGAAHRRDLGQRRPEDAGLRREPAAAAQAGRHDPVPRDQQDRPVRHQRAVGLQRHGRCGPGLRRQRQRHLLGWRPAGTSSRATAATTWRSVATATTSSRTSAVPTSSRVAPATTPLDGGIGDDIFMGGDGQDFINGGANDNEAFAGPGDDFVIAGQGADAVFGDGGDDWIQGGSGQDLLQGDHGAPFFDDPAETKPGNDVFVGQVGENDYDAEGGDDIMAQNAVVDRNAGAGGFDWAIHQYDTVGADDDMMINNNLGGLPIQVVVNRDRWQETEADSGSALDDVIKGTDDVLARRDSSAVAGSPAATRSTRPGSTGSRGWPTCFPPLDQGSATLPTWLRSRPPASARSSGPVWGEGDILLGGGGSDTLEGRDGDDIIDGDQAARGPDQPSAERRDPATRSAAPT